MAEKSVEAGAVDVVAPLENAAAKALVVSEGASLLVIDLTEKGLGFDVVEGAAAEVDGLNNEVEVVAGAALLLLCWLPKRLEFDVEEAELKEAKLGLNGDSVPGLDESGAKLLEEGLKVDGEGVEEDPEGA